MLTFVLAAFLTGTPQGPDKLTSVRAFVFTETSPSGQPDDDERGRLDAVKEMREALAKKKGISVVDNRADATLLVEVVGRELRDEGGGGFGGAQITATGDTIIRLHLRRAERGVRPEGHGPGHVEARGEDAADRIMQWIARREPKRVSRPSSLAPCGAPACAPPRCAQRADLAARFGEAEADVRCHRRRARRRATRRLARRA